MRKQNTKYIKSEDRNRNWYMINAEGLVLGRLASEVAKQIMGKNNVNYSPSFDTGDYIIVYNAEKVILTGKKAVQKVYYRHSGYPGGLKEISYKTMLASKPEEVIRIAVKGMLPKNRLGRKMLNKLKVYRGTTDKHDSQKPKELLISSLEESQ